MDSSTDLEAKEGAEEETREQGRLASTISTLISRVSSREFTSLPPRVDLAWGRKWILFVSAFALYNMLVIPLRLGFRYFWCNSTMDVVFAILDYTGDLVFVIDIWLSFHFAILQDGIEINDRKGIRKCRDRVLQTVPCRSHRSVMDPSPLTPATAPTVRTESNYVDGAFAYDLLASLPIDLFIWGPGCWQHVAARMNKALRLTSVGTLARWSA